MKKLPINKDPYLRTYTHHGYLHAILSAEERVQHLNETVALIAVKKFSDYQWDIQNEGLIVETNSEGVISIKANKWNTNMNASFFRQSLLYDEMEIDIYKQIYTNVWGSIFVFCATKGKKCLTDFDSSYLFTYGRMAKDGIFYRIGTQNHIVLCNAPVLPVRIRMIKQASMLCIEYSDIAGNIKKRIELKEFSQNCDLVGFCIELRNNSYYEWLYSNYINLYINEKKGIPIDFLCNNQKDWHYNTFNYFLDYSIVTQKDLQALCITELDYIKRMIEAEHYIELLINDNIHRGNYNVKKFHQDLIYGYSDEKKCLFVLYYINGKIGLGKMSYDDFESKYNYLKDRKIYLLKYNPGYEEYKLSVKHLIQVFKEYSSSVNYSNYESENSGHSYFGIEALRRLQSSEGYKLLVSDIRVSHLLYEHSKLNNDRIEYLYYKNVIDNSNYERIHNLTCKTLDTSLILRNLILKILNGGKYRENSISKYLEQFIDNEIKVVENIVEALQKNVEE